MPLSISNSKPAPLFYAKVPVGICALRIVALEIAGDEEILSAFIRQRTFLLAQTLQHAVPQFTEFAIQEMLAPEERQ